MDPIAPSPTLTALGSARRLLADAARELLAVRRRAEVLVDATDWHARATGGYRAGVSALADDLAALIRLLDVSDADLTQAQHAERVGSMAQW